MYPREMISLAGSSSHVGNSTAQGPFGAIIQPQPLPWVDSVGLLSYRKREKTVTQRFWVKDIRSSLLLFRKVVYLGIRLS